MNNLVSKVTPLTRSIIWFTEGGLKPASPTYKAIDYLLNGLLTESLNSNSEITSRVIISTNFNFPLHVFVTKDLLNREYDSFLKLLQKDLIAENSILVIDESDSFSDLMKMSPPDIKSRLQLYK